MKEQEEKMISSIRKRFRDTPKESAREYIRNEAIRNAKRTWSERKRLN